MHFIRGLKLMSTVYAVWPMSGDSKKVWTYIYQSVWWFHFLNYIAGVLFTLNTCYQGRNDLELVTFSALEALSFVEPLIVLINYKYYINRLQYLLSQTKNYVEKAGPDQKMYLKERGPIFAMMMVLIILLYGILIMLYLMYPVVTTWETFLTTAYYPPSIRSSAVDVLLLTHQLALMFHSSVMVVFDTIVVTLIYGCTVRLKILADRFRETTHYEELIDCVREHQEILTLANDTNKVVRFVVLKTVLCFIGYTVGAGLQVVNPKATTVSLGRFGVVLLINCVRLIMIALSADDLSKTSQEIGSSIYFSVWYEDDRESVIAKKLIMLRCQIFSKVRVAGFMPALSLTFITGIISTAISYFTTLRAVTTS